MAEKKTWFVHMWICGYGQYNLKTIRVHDATGYLKKTFGGTGSFLLADNTAVKFTITPVTELGRWYHDELHISVNKRDGRNVVVTKKGRSYMESSVGTNHPPLHYWWRDIAGAIGLFTGLTMEVWRQSDPYGQKVRVLNSPDSRLVRKTGIVMYHIGGDDVISFTVWHPEIRGHYGYTPNQLKIVDWNGN